ncbi:hypothetical protein BVRB_2g034410 [Beta vulgaris subsp. vulgaris]|uniref:uncharacterized protein LOC104886656 n=1 Tax=Beta vulgaris subsp. vulgaris TaxID=3555 RepID=UPI00053F6BE1|nr:uncharacterized protein LOC104886656 [Beta vulgaris subsp. vulgaris]KMT17915.1 hypothetical protein BVRB_2g034410 [Beta vulgaris subsp. vulgaris]
MDDLDERSSYMQNGNMQLDFYHGNTTKNTWNDRKSYSLGPYHGNNNNVFDTQIPNNNFDNKLKKSKTMSHSKVWCFSDPEFKRKRRVATYRSYTVEGKVKGSFKKGFNWIKEKLIYGFW